MDYAEWLTPERLIAEEEAWASSRDYVRYADAVTALVDSDPSICTIQELGSGTGWVPWELSQRGILRHRSYVGLDKNVHCLDKARERNAFVSQVAFGRVDLRTYHPIADVVCSFAVLKHFRLEEWERLFVQWFRAARYGCFTVPIAGQSRADSEPEFTHVWLSEADLAQAIRAAGHEEVRRVADPFEPIIITRRAGA